MKSSTWGLMVFWLFLGIQTQVKADLIVNGGFETGDFSGWTTIPAASGSFLVVDGYAPHTGNYAADFGASGPLVDSIAQTLATTAGQSYVIDYWLTNNRGNANLFEVSWGGAVIPGSVISNSQAFPYTEFTFTVAAAASSTVIQFSGYNPPGRFSLDDVSVNPIGAAVPEPSSLVLMFVGAVGLTVYGGWRRTSK